MSEREIRSLIDLLGSPRARSRLARVSCSTVAVPGVVGRGPVESLDPRGPCDRYGPRDVRDATVDARRTEIQAADREAAGRRSGKRATQVRGGTCPDGPAAGAGPRTLRRSKGSGETVPARA